MDRRDFLLAGAASGAALALGPAALARALVEARAVRDPAGVRLSWTPAARPASVFVSSDPDAAPAYMRPLRTKLRGGALNAPLPVSPRPYFVIVTEGEARPIRVAERLLPLQGGRNFRDLGGYRTIDGRQVRWGRIYRSGMMSGLTAADMSYLAALGVEVICDLRSSQERRAQPNPFLKAEAPSVVATDYDMMSFAGFTKASTRAEAVTAFADAYVGFLDVLTPQYTDLFARLVRRETPLAFNCSAGKDRTGMGAALILSVLGVPRQTVLADYGLTELYTPPSLYMKALASGGLTPGLPPEQARAFARMPRDVLEVMMGSTPDVMRQALAQIDAKFGGPVELAKARFGLTDAKIAHLRSVYLS